MVGVHMGLLQKFISRRAVEVMRCVAYWREIEWQSWKTPEKTWSNLLMLQYKNWGPKRGMVLMNCSIAIQWPKLDLGPTVWMPKLWLLPPLWNSWILFGYIPYQCVLGTLPRWVPLDNNSWEQGLEDPTWKGPRGILQWEECLVEAQKEANPQPWANGRQLLALPGEGAGMEANESDGSPCSCCDSAAQSISEYTHNGRTEEDHAHWEGSYPCCREKKHKDTLV